MIGLLRNYLFSISADEASFVKRGFTVDHPTRRSHLEHCAGAFILGYNAALRAADLSELPETLAEVDRPSRGFAYEGAAMGLALRDGLNPIRCMHTSPRFNHFLEGPGRDHIYMAHVGAGWAVARLPWIRRKLDVYVQQFDPLLRWLVHDGYGFHQGFFESARFVEKQERPRGLSHYGQRAFDQGLGRCLWFVHGGDVVTIADNIAHFDADRRADLYSGLGLAITYAGGAPPQDAEVLLGLSNSHRWNLAQGAAFAAKARQSARNLTEPTEAVCHILCRTSAEEAAMITDQCLRGLDYRCCDAAEPAYEVWRHRIAATIEKRECHATHL